MYAAGAGNSTRKIAGKSNFIGDHRPPRSQSTKMVSSMSKTVWFAIVFGLGVIVLLVYLTMGLRQFTCEVCIQYNGRTNCATASGTTKQEALRTASDTACATISGGMTESIQCGNTPPLSVTWIK